MLLLLSGLTLWVLVHFIPVFAPNIRTKLIGTIGAGPYKGIFSLSLVAAIALMVNGWQSAPEEFYFPQMAGIRELSFLLILIGMISFVASGMKSNIKRHFRHPQLNGVMLWAFAHILSNGQAKAVILFSGIFVWAFLMKVGANKRDGPWVRPEAVNYSQDAKMVIVAIALYALLVYLHQYFAVALI